MHSRDIEGIVRSFGYLLNPASRARDGASACTIADQPFNLAKEHEKWRHGPEDTRPDTPRSIAFLAAYAMIFGEGISPAGVPTSDRRWFRPDRSVVRACIRSGDMILTDGSPPILSLSDIAYERVARALTALNGNAE